MHWPGADEPPRVAIEPSGEQRQACRYEASDFEAQIGWWEGEEFRSHPARLVNVSHNGALIVTEARPPQGTTVGLCLEEPEPTDWVEARLIESCGGHQLRLAFLESCPYEFFKAAIAISRKGKRGEA